MRQQLHSVVNYHYHLRGGSSPGYTHEEVYQYEDLTTFAGPSGYCDAIAFKCTKQDCDQQMLPDGEIIVVPLSLAEDLMNSYRRFADQAATTSHGLGYDEGYKAGYEDGIEDGE